MSLFCDVEAMHEGWAKLQVKVSTSGITGEDSHEVRKVLPAA